MLGNLVGTLLVPRRLERLQGPQHLGELSNWPGTHDEQLAHAAASRGRPAAAKTLEWRARSCL